MDSIINQDLLKTLQFHSLLSDHQDGFRKDRATSDLISYLTDKWSQALNNFGENMITARDISKTFDRDWHKNLLSKHPAYGIRPNLNTWFGSLLTGRTITACVIGALLKPHLINSGSSKVLSSPQHYSYF